MNNRWGIAVNVGNYWDQTQCYDNYCKTSSGNWIPNRVYVDGNTNCEFNMGNCLGGFVACAPQRYSAACPTTCKSTSTLTHNGTPVVDVFKSFLELPFTLDVKTFFNNPESLTLDWASLVQLSGGIYTPIERVSALVGIQPLSNSANRASNPDNTIIEINAPTGGDIPLTQLYVEYKSFSCVNEIPGIIDVGSTTTSYDANRLVMGYIPVKL